MNAKLFHLMARVSELDAEIPDGELLWVDALRKVLPRSSLRSDLGLIDRPETPEKLVEAVVIGTCVEGMKEDALEDLKRVAASEKSRTKAIKDEEK